MSLTITYVSDYDRWYAAEKLARKANKNVLMPFGLLKYVFPSIAAAYLILLVWQQITSKETVQSNFGVFAMAYLILWAILMGQAPASRRARFQKLWPPGIEVHRNTIVFSEHEVCTSSAGIGESRLEWAAIRKIVQDDRLALLYLTPCSSIVVPLEGLTPAERTYLDMLFATKVKESL